MKIKQWENNNEAQLFEQKRKEINKLIWLNNVSIKENITLFINPWCKELIKTLHKEYSNTEWLAVCKIVQRDRWQFEMVDMLFPHQTWIGWECETTKEWMNWLTEELIRRWEKQTDWNCIMHSHHHMWVFWSSTDDNARLNLNDGRKMEWAVVTAYEWDKISYKWCLNFYKPYNIEIDVNVVDNGEISVVDKYKEYGDKVWEAWGRWYDNLLELNKEKIDNLTEKPSYSTVLDYLWIDITDSLDENYNKIKDKIWNPELLDYLKQLELEADKYAENEINKQWNYVDMLAEYDAFCTWSDELLIQLKGHREKERPLTCYWWQTYSSSIYTPSLYNDNRFFEDETEDYYFVSNAFDENYVRTTFAIDDRVPLKVWKNGERLAWSYVSNDYLYVEDWADEVEYGFIS